MRYQTLDRIKNERGKVLPKASLGIGMKAPTGKRSELKVEIGNTREGTLAREQGK